MKSGRHSFCDVITASGDYCLQRCFSAEEYFVLPGNTSQCPVTSLAIPGGGRDAPGIQWVHVRDSAQCTVPHHRESSGPKCQQSKVDTPCRGSIYSRGAAKCYIFNFIIHFLFISTNTGIKKNFLINYLVSLREDSESKCKLMFNSFIYQFSKY